MTTFCPRRSGYSKLAGARTEVPWSNRKYWGNPFHQKVNSKFLRGHINAPWLLRQGNAFDKAVEKGCQACGSQPAPVSSLW